MLTKRSKYNISKTRSSNSIVIDFSCSCIFWLPVWIVFIAIVFFGFICWPWLLFAGFCSHFLLVSLPVSNILVLYKLKRLHSRLVWNYLERLGWVSLENKFILWHSLFVSGALKRGCTVCTWAQSGVLFTIPSMMKIKMSGKWTSSFSVINVHQV